MIYFAYGSNMCLPRLLGRVKSAQFVEVAKVEGRCVEFHKRSDCEYGSSGKATVVRKEGSTSFGGLFSFDEKDLGGLRKAEGHPKHYREESVPIITSSGTTMAMTYIANAEYIDLHQIPYDWYVDLIRFGGRQLGIPEDYISRFDIVKTKIDPDSFRSEREREYLR